jgi:hypothetical protein
VRASFLAHGSSAICPRSWAPCWACDLHVGASPWRVLQTSLSGVLTASPALLIPITCLPPSPRQPIGWRSQQPSLRGESHPMPYVVDTDSPAPRVPVRTPPGDAVPQHRWSLGVGPHASPGVSGGSLGRLQTRPALIRAVLAHANHPRRLVPRHDDADGDSSPCPCTARRDGIRSRMLRDRLLSPLGGLMLSRDRRGEALISTPERQECHLHGDDVITDPRISAPHPPEPCEPLVAGKRIAPAVGG